MIPSADIPVLETERLTLRAPAARDVAPYVEMLGEERAEFVGGPVDPDLAWRAFAAEIGHWTLRGYGRWTVIERGTRAYCGIVGPWFPEGWPEPEIGWTLAGAAEGRGIAFEAAEAALRVAYDRFGWTTAISLIDPANVRSVALAERLGATAEGRFAHVRYGEMGVWRHAGPGR